MILRVVIVFIVLAVCYIKCPLTLCLSNDPTFMWGELQVYSVFLVVYVLFEIVYSVSVAYFRRKSQKNLEGVLDNMRGAVESMISEKYNDADKYLDKIEKLTGDDIAVVNWMRGCNKLYMKNMLEAKAKFYQAAYSEKAILGSYSLYKLAVLEGDDHDAYDALKHIKSHVKDMPDSVLRDLVKFQFLNKEFDEARVNINRLGDKRLMGISYFLEDGTTLENLKKAADNANDVPDIAIAYAKKLLFLGETRKAKKVIMDSWRSTHAPELFKFFVGANSEDKLHTAKKFLKNISYEGVSEFAALLYEKAMFPMAYKYFKEAFVLYPTEKTLFYINELRDKLGKHDDLIMKEEIEIDETVLFEEPCWMCNSCRSKLSKWEAFCPSCGGLDTSKWTYFKDVKKLRNQVDKFLPLNMK